MHQRGNHPPFPAPSAKESYAWPTRSKIEDIPASIQVASIGRSRSIDILRGLVMVLMALDHTRDFWSRADFSPTDLGKTDLAWFLTRWITHFCAPVFVLLAGVSAFFTSSRREGAGPWARFLIVRGLWLMVLEVTWVRLSWVGNLNYQGTFLQVIWAIGLAMVVLGVGVLVNAKIFRTGPLGRPDVIGLIGLLIILGHNTLDDYRGELLSGWIKPLWMMVHQVGSFQVASGYQVTVYYPVLAWIGVLFVGFYLGFWWSHQKAERAKPLMALGGIVSCLFLLIRMTQVYGDPSPWVWGQTWDKTLMSFLNTTKYPPSLAYLMMTLGPALIILGWMESKNKNIMFNFLSEFGKVPLFFYLVHLPLIHGSSRIYATLTLGAQGSLTQGADPKSYGFGLLGVYGVSALIVFMLFPLCCWFGRLKAQYPSSWIRFL